METSASTPDPDSQSLVAEARKRKGDERL